MKHDLRALEETVVDAWPVPESEELDGWLLRRSGGPSRRGNSVAPLDAGRTMELEARLAAVEAWYAARGQPAMFQVGPCAAPKDLDSVLEARGYGVAGAAHLTFAEPDEVRRRTRSSLSVRVETKPSAAFRSVVEAASRFAPTYDVFAGILGRLGTRCRYATAFDASDTPLACCVGIASEDLLGVYAMITRPEQRRRGAARALLNALATRAQADDARGLYLLVDTENAAARALYAASGFADVYAYHYRVAPPLKG